MKLCELMRVLPGYTHTLVHDSKGEFGHRGNPHEYVMGLYKRYADWCVVQVVPIASYTVEVTIEEVV